VRAGVVELEQKSATCVQQLLLRQQQACGSRAHPSRAGHPLENRRFSGCVSVCAAKTVPWCEARAQGLVYGTLFTLGGRGRGGTIPPPPPPKRNEKAQRPKRVRSAVPRREGSVQTSNSSTMPTRHGFDWVARLYSRSGEPTATCTYCRSGHTTIAYGYILVQTRPVTQPSSMPHHRIACWPGTRRIHAAPNPQGASAAVRTARAHAACTWTLRPRRRVTLTRDPCQSEGASGGTHGV
jgi:hypothetical protein